MLAAELVCGDFKVDGLFESGAGRPNSGDGANKHKRTAKSDSQNACTCIANVKVRKRLLVFKFFGTENI